jgi:hypothetical protein
MRIHMVLALCACATLTPANPVAAGQADTRVIVEFQRAADSYAFAHRQADRRGGRNDAVEGVLFTPEVVRVLRSQIANGVKRSGCEIKLQGNSVVPRVNQSTDGTFPLSSCLAALLPRMPEELEYRTAGRNLILADAHLHIVVDVLHDAIPEN